MKQVQIGSFSKDKGITVKHIQSHRPVLNRPIQHNKNPHDKGKAKKRGLLNNLPLIILSLIVIGVGAFAYYRWNSLQQRVKKSDSSGNIVSTCTNILDPSCWTEAFRPQLKQENGYTNMLIVGLDTRDSGRGSSLMNTDTIMVASLDHKTNRTMLISIPRDFYVTFKIGTSGPYSMKINSVYATGEVRNDVEDGMTLLQDVVEEVIGQQIQYRTVVKLQAVEDIVNTFGGVDIYIEKAFSAQYPNDNPTAAKPQHWLRYDFPQGDNHLDGEHALVYARFRHIYSGDESLASDFSRGVRQQQVIKALKEKALSEDLSVKDKAEKYWGTLQTLNKNVETDLSFEDILAALSLINKVDTDPISVVLDPDFGNEPGKYIYHPPTNEQTGYIIKTRTTGYKSIQDQLKIIWKYGHIYDEKAHLLIANKSGKPYAAGDKAFELKSHEAPLKRPITYLTQAKTDKTEINIYDFSNGKYPETIKFLKEYFGVSEVNTDPAAAGVTKSAYKEDILIIVGPPAPSITPTVTTQP